MSLSNLTVRPIILVFIFLGLVGYLPASASSPAKPKPPEDHRILVKNVNVPAMQITIVFKNTGQTEVYTVDDLTHVTIGNNPGTIKDIKAGQQIFAYTERDAHSLDSVTVGAADPPPSK